MPEKYIYSEKTETPLGEMLICASEKHLLLAEFTDRNKFDKQIEGLKKYLPFEIKQESNFLIEKTKNLLDKYFKNEIKEFNLPLKLTGTDFQKTVWKKLLKIPYGKTVSYSDIAVSINKKTAVRAVAGATGANKFAIIIPCHRVIASNGTLGGYAGGIYRKKYLLKTENALK